MSGSANTANYANTAGTANSVAWSNVSDKPATATRWPSWSEVTNKPTIDNNNQKISVGTTGFGANDTIKIAGGTNISVSADTTNKTITVSGKSDADIKSLAEAQIKTHGGVDKTGTVTSVAAGEGLTGGPITTSGTISHAIPSGAEAKPAGLYKVGTDKFGHVTSMAPVTKADITNLGIPGAAQPIKTLKTDNTTAQATSAGESIAGSGTINLHKVAKTGNYNDLNNKPTIPTVNNGTLTIQKNGSNVASFTANSSSNVTANITVPTKTSDLNNDSGYITGYVNTTYTFTQNATDGHKIALAGSDGKNTEITIPDNDTKYSAGTGLTLNGTTFNVNTGYTSSGRNYAVKADTNGNLYVYVPWVDNDTTYSGSQNGLFKTFIVGDSIHTSLLKSWEINMSSTSDGALTKLFGSVYDNDYLKTYMYYPNSTANDSQASFTPASGLWVYDKTHLNDFCDFLSRHSSAYDSWLLANDDMINNTTDGNRSCPTIYGYGYIGLGTETSSDSSTPHTIHYLMFPEDSSLSDGSDTLSPICTFATREWVKREYGSKFINSGTGLEKSVANDSITFNLKTATTSTVGGVKAAAVNSSSITTTQTSTSGRYYGLQVDSNGKGYVNVPWTDNASTYSYSKSEIDSMLNDKLSTSGGTLTGSLDTNSFIRFNDITGLRFGSNIDITNIMAGSVDISVGPTVGNEGNAYVTWGGSYSHGSGTWYIALGIVKNTGYVNTLVAGAVPPSSSGSGMKIYLRRVYGANATYTYTVNWVAIKVW